MAPLPSTSPSPLSSPLFPSASRGLNPLLRTSEAVCGRAPLRSSNPFRSRRRVASAGSAPPTRLRTCKNCKKQFDAALNHPAACRFHTAHFGGETQRKFESVYAGGTMDTPDSGKVFQYWHCCGSEDPFDPGCTAAPHASYDDV